jgi:Mini-chromosome maintenance replisome factor
MSLIFPAEKHSGNNEWKKEVETYFTSRLSNPATWNSIVSINEAPIKEIRHGQLVRFRGMIQDQLGLEMFGSTAVLKNQITGNQRTVTGKYQDELSFSVSFIWNSIFCLKAVTNSQCVLGRRRSIRLLE